MIFATELIPELFVEGRRRVRRVVSTRVGRVPSEFHIILGRTVTLTPSHDAPRPVRLP
jgi:hypothetical protein